ncbi:Ribose/xylose/arabinose/galactoside ABC-type transport system permease component [Gaiella occulta]|uniref:Xylose transport system permease protein XylH n=1 Tax=Gaiella occulta TaxID=1002870 RepID=A0A7M2Z102_9ACTN|nr:ABC transporter permease [Gaiella occulta]RDI75705.1 Ribose/xylose/arabinose/galactoside ABC-type transport system permease component [Gaiella occulta]
MIEIADDADRVAGTTADERVARVGVLARALRRPDIGALIGAVAVFLLFAYTARDVNWVSDGSIISSWVNTAAYVGIVAAPVALLMIGGEFDLSAGVMVGSSGLLLGLLTTRADWNIWPAIVVVILFGLTVGFLNGYTVVRTKLPSFIVTLGTFFILRGLNAGGVISLTGTVSIDEIDAASGFDSARKLFASTIWPQYGLSVTVVWWLGITVLAAWLLARTRFGNWIFSVGGDPVAARNVGVPVARTKILLFMMTSTVASLWGIMIAISLRGIQSNEGVGREFEFIIAAVVGGCLLTGGYGSVLGAAFGAAILGMAQIGIIVSQWDTNWVFFFEGVVLVLAVMLNTAIRRRAERSR